MYSQLLLLRLQSSYRPILFHLDHFQQGWMGSYRDYLDLQANEGVRDLRSPIRR